MCVCVLCVRDCAAATILRNVPRELLLLLKTNDCLRAVDHSLGAPINTYVVMARRTSRALYQESWAKATTWGCVCGCVGVWCVRTAVHASQLRFVAGRGGMHSGSMHALKPLCSHGLSPYERSALCAHFRVAGPN